MDRSSLAKCLDHTLLREDASDEDLQRVCREAREYGFCSVCVYWHQVKKVAEWLKGSDVLPICVVGFPSGSPAPNFEV